MITLSCHAMPRHHRSTTRAKRWPSQVTSLLHHKVNLLTFCPRSSFFPRLPFDLFDSDGTGPRGLIGCVCAHPLRGLCFSLRKQEGGILLPSELCTALGCTRLRSSVACLEQLCLWTPAHESAHVHVHTLGSLVLITWLSNQQGIGRDCVQTSGWSTLW